MSFLICKNLITKTVAVLVFISLGSCFGQENKNTKQKPPGSSQGVTPEQSTIIKRILSAYNPASLTAEEAKSIHDQFREAGIHAGPENNNTIKALGFDPEKLRNLAPPPETGKNEKQNPPPLQERLKVVEDKICKQLALTAEKRETIISAFSVFYSEMDKLIKSQSGPQGPPEKSKVDPLEQTRDSKVKQVLTGEQFKKFLELEKEARPNRPGEKKPKLN